MLLWSVTKKLLFKFIYKRHSDFITASLFTKWMNYSWFNQQREKGSNQKLIQNYFEEGSKAVTRKFSVKKVFLKISQNSQEGLQLY